MRIRMAEDYVYDTVQDCAAEDCESLDLPEWADEEDMIDDTNNQIEGDQ